MEKTNLSDDHFKLDDTRVTRRAFAFSIITLVIFAVGACMVAVGLFGGFGERDFLFSVGSIMAGFGGAGQLISLTRSAMAKDFGIGRPTYDLNTYDTVGIRRKLFPGEKHK